MSFLAVDGARLETRWWPPAEPATAEPPVVLLHEGLGSVSTWRDFPAEVAARTGRAVFAYSRRGHGQSDPRGNGLAVDFMHREADEVLPRVLDAAGIDRAVLFGHSDGGSIALLAAAAAPDARGGARARGAARLRRSRSIASIAAIGDRYRRDAELRRRLAAHHAHVDEVFQGWNDVWLSADFRAWNIEAEVAAVRCPVLVLQGGDDEYGTTAQVDAIAQRLNAPLTAIVIQKCGHNPHRDQPSVVLDHLSRFMARRHGWA